MNIFIADSDVESFARARVEKRKCVKVIVRKHSFESVVALMAELRFTFILIPVPSTRHAT